MKNKKSGLGFIDKVFLWINLLLCVALLLSYLAPSVNPNTFWLIAFFGLAYPPILLLNVIMMLVWLLRWRWPAALSMITILIGWGVLNNNVGLRTASTFSPAPGINSIRLMTYNVHNFKRYGAKNDVSTKHEILELINDQKPDIIGFQEFYTRYKGEYDMRDSIVKIMGANNYYFEPLNFNSSEAIGMAVFSKYPIVAKGLIQLAADRSSANQCLYIDVKKGEKTFRVYSLHLQSIKFNPEDYKYLDSVSKKGKTDMQSTKRLGGKLKAAFIKRSEQVFKIKAHAAQCPYPYIISGDFNDTPTSFAVNQMAKGLKNAFREKGAGFGRTYNGDFPNYQIDYIMVSPQFDVASYLIVEKKLSDHFPLRSDLILN
ncbi:endonuclease/exonuclease/phosphatase family protein [Mucilaginibacter ginsenosidivorax]|uniref:Endonuclease/exonuclease/phosphatase family protein n=1 Tax=Mucilaginibacter ginsenosidivorax TaxID=862126 RepID=A0A5B8W3Y2_9SPHI|nr:endonuclease/exonuclease/phosphatase family protein [Mucilaginibacter ginsenosidivorax]QEC77028.1 endonuclease/exonuclease/phosphatase family protein [Mucilaginibacter ginsenosidivorax]